MLQRVVNTLVMLFWVSFPLLGMSLIVPWMRIGWLLDALAVPVAASAFALMLLATTPGYVSPISQVVADRVVYVFAFFLAVYTVALS